MIHTTLIICILKLALCIIKVVNFCYFSPFWIESSARYNIYIYKGPMRRKKLLPLSTKNVAKKSDMDSW